MNLEGDQVSASKVDSIAEETKNPEQVVLVGKRPKLAPYDA